MKMHNNINIKNAIFICMAAMLFFGAKYTVNAQAAENQYRYTVIFRSGNKGEFDDGSNKLSEAIEYGTSYEEIVPEVLVPKKSNYYFKGWNYDVPDKVTGRMEFTAKYGVIVDEVEYCVKYVDSTGVDIATPVIKKGNLGDSITVYAKSVEGYSAKLISQDTKLKENTNVVFTYSSNITTDGNITKTDNKTTNDTTSDSSNQEAKHITVVENVYESVEDSSVTTEGNKQNSAFSSDVNSEQDFSDNTGDNSQNEENNDKNQDSDVNNDEDDVDKDNDVLSDDAVDIEEDEVPKTTVPGKDNNMIFIIGSIIALFLGVVVVTIIIVNNNKAKKN